MFFKKINCLINFKEEAQKIKKILINNSTDRIDRTKDMSVMLKISEWGKWIG